MASRFMVVPASYVVFTRRYRGREQVLLQLRDGTGYMDGYWASAAAGHIEMCESVFEAAAREAQEELGVTNLHLRPLCAMHRTHSDAAIDQRVDFFLQAVSWSGEPRIMEEHKCSDLRWFDLDALPHPVVPHELYVIQRMTEGTMEPILTHGF